MIRPILIALALPGMAMAQTVTSAGPDGVSVTVYRAPYRSSDQAMDLDWLEGYALITERRTITIPQGEATIRFEGVAGGILPESAIVTGLPEGVVEKNQDADLLSPRSLIDRSEGRRVTIRRTSRATGAVTQEDAVIRSGADGAVVLQTRAGFEALRCSGLPETLVHDSVPTGLSAKPTLSVLTRSTRAASATVTLSYLAAGFDWQANYVAELAPDRRSMDLFAWLTLASGDQTSFVDAGTQAVAGKVNREDDDYSGDGGGSDSYLSLACWPAGTTSSGRTPYDVPPPPPPPAPMVMMAPAMMARADDESEAASIIVTGTMVRQEELADLKLYRIPQPVTVAANSQKQVALMDRKAVPVTILYRTTILDDEATDPVMTLRTRNREQEGLGLPLPAGPVALFQKSRDTALLIGESTLADKAVGEDVEMDGAEATQITVDVEDVDGGADWDRRRVTVSNATPEPQLFEARIRVDQDQRLKRFSQRMARKDGDWLWAVTVPANGTATLEYRAEDVNR